MANMQIFGVCQMLYLLHENKLHSINTQINEVPQRDVCRCPPTPSLPLSLSLSLVLCVLCDAVKRLKLSMTNCVALGRILHIDSIMDIACIYMCVYIQIYKFMCVYWHYICHGSTSSANPHNCCHASSSSHSRRPITAKQLESRKFLIGCKRCSNGNL